MSASTVQEITTAERLRLLADWYEQHPDATPAFQTILEPCNTAEEIAARALALGGRWKKQITGEDWFNLVQEIAPGIEYCLFASRLAVCTKRVTGTEKVMAPAPDAPMVEVEREVVEWDCPSSLLALGGQRP